MTTRLVNGVRVAYTAAEEIMRAAEEAAWLAKAGEREIAKKLEDFKSDKDMPTLEQKVDAILKDLSGANVDVVKAKIEELKVKHGV